MEIQIIPDGFAPVINVEYPKNNFVEYERWLSLNYKGCNTDRIYLPILWTGYYVNNNYGNDKKALQDLQDYINSLDKTKKYWTCIQYDDSILNNVSDLDILRFEMSKTSGIGLPLISQPHPYIFNEPKKYFASFVGSRTHPIRNELEKFKGKEGWYISFEPHSNEEYCRVLHQSVFSLCPRGYGLSSFRTTESLQYGAIPVYISDEFVVPFNNDFLYGIRCLPSDDIVRTLETIPDWKIAEWVSELPKWYQEYYTYEGCFKNIIRELETEFDNRQKEIKTTETA